MLAQDLVVRRHYGAKLAVINIGNPFTTGPKEATYLINELIKPTAVIPSHENEEATKCGIVINGSRTDSLILASAIPVHLPLSGRTMVFYKDADCVSGC